MMTINGNNDNINRSSENVDCRDDEMYSVLSIMMTGDVVLYQENDEGIFIEWRRKR